MQHLKDIFIPFRRNLLPLACFSGAIISYLVCQQTAYVDQLGFVHEAFFLIPISCLLIFLGFATLFALHIRSTRGLVSVVFFSAVAFGACRLFPIATGPLFVLNPLALTAMLAGLAILSLRQIRRFKKHA